MDDKKNIAPTEGTELNDKALEQAVGGLQIDDEEVQKKMDELLKVFEGPHVQA